MHEVLAPLTPRPGRAERWLSRAFGVDFDLGFDAPPLPRVADLPPESEPTRVDLVYAENIDDVWPAEEARRTGSMGAPGEEVMTVDEHATAGYLIRLVPYGRYLVSADGMSVACAPPAVAWWYWQRLLIGQVLPAVAALRGAEVLHASATVIDGRAIAFAGQPGSGKSSLALQLMRLGHGLLAEDVLAVVDRDGRLMAEPGAAMFNLRKPEWERVREGTGGSIGAPVGQSEDKVHLIASRESHAVPLGALYLLEPGDGTQPTFERIEAPGFADILANSFVLYIIRTGRLMAQLDLAARLARTVPTVRLRVHPDTNAETLAHAVEEHARSLIHSSTDDAAARDTA